MQLREELLRVQGRAGEMDEEMGMALDELDELKADNQGLDELEGVLGEAEAAQAQADSLASELASARAGAAQLAEELHGWQERHCPASEERTELSSDLAAARASVDAGGTEAAAIRERLAALEAELRAVKASRDAEREAARASARELRRLRRSGVGVGGDAGRAGGAGGEGAGAGAGAGGGCGRCEESLKELLRIEGAAEQVGARRARCARNLLAPPSRTVPPHAVS